jgi:hypothetical protein
MRLRAVIQCMLAISCLIFGAALFSPLFSVLPGAGRWTELVKIIDPAALEGRTYTLPSGIAELWASGAWWLAILLGSLSLVLPIGKFCVLWWETSISVQPSRWVLQIFRASAGYAMVEVFLVSLLILVTRGIPGGSRVELHSGMFLFTGSVVLSFLAARLQEGAELGTQSRREDSPLKPSCAPAFDECTNSQIHEREERE